MPVTRAFTCVRQELIWARSWTSTTARCSPHLRDRDNHPASVDAERRLAMSDRNIYGEVNSVSSIREINRKIRDEIRSVGDRKHLTDLKKRSDYLCTLTQAPSWRKKFGFKSGRMLAVAKEEDERTT